MKRFINNLVLFIAAIALAGYFLGITPENYKVKSADIYENVKIEALGLYDKGVSILQELLIAYNLRDAKDTSFQGVANPVGELNKILLNKNQGNSRNTAGLPEYKYTANSYDEYYKAIYHALDDFESNVTIRVTGYDPNTDSVDIVNKVIYDHFDIDYGIKSIGANIYTSGKYHTVSFTFEYNFDRSKMLSMKAASEEKSRQIISEIIKPGMSDIQKELAIHDYIVKNTSYDYENLKRGTLPEEVYTIYGVLINKKAVCEGYAKAMFKLLNMAGVENLVVIGEADGTPHAWNLVKINGFFTHLDSTWDDPVVVGSNKGVLRHKYFNISDEQIAKDHKWDTSKYPKGVAVPLK